MGIIILLLASDDPGVRYLALRDLMDAPPDDPELVRVRNEAIPGARSPHPGGNAADGYWSKPDQGMVEILLDRLGAHFAGTVRRFGSLG